MCQNAPKKEESSNGSRNTKIHAGRGPLHSTLIAFYFDFALYHFQTFITTLTLSTYAKMVVNCGFELHVRASMLDDGKSSLLYACVGRKCGLPY
jgi:hypothetical protein